MVLALLLPFAEGLHRLGQSSQRGQLLFLVVPRDIRFEHLVVSRHQSPDHKRGECQLMPK